MRNIAKSITEKENPVTFVEKLAIKANLANFTGTIEKSIDAATAFRVGGAYVPEVASEIISRIIEQDEFIKLLNTVRPLGKTYQIPVWTGNTRTTKRPTYGAAPATDSDINLSNVGNTMTLLPMQETYILTDDAIQENLDNPSFETYVQSEITKLAANNLADLSANGIDDDYAGAAWEKLNKGYVTLMKADTAVNDVDYESCADMSALFEAMDAKMPTKYNKDKDIMYFVTYSDWAKYRTLINSTDSTGKSNQGEKVYDYNGRKIMWLPYLPAGHAFMTNPKNLYLAFNKDGMNLEIERRAKGACFEMVMNYQADFQLGNGEAIVLAS
jgi:hypothetical protein